MHTKQEEKERQRAAFLSPTLPYSATRCLILRPANATGGAVLMEVADHRNYSGVGRRLRSFLTGLHEVSAYGLNLR